MTPSKDIEVKNFNKNGIIMSARHMNYPIEGVLFHPESILSSKNDVGIEIIKNLIIKGI